MQNETVSYKNVLMFGGAFVAFLIGSGFATGQEVLQYFTAYGYWGLAGAALTMVLLIYVGSSFIATGFENKFEKGSDIFKYYCGKKIGIFFDYFSVLFIFLSFIVMLSGAGATVHQQYGIPPVIGCVSLGFIAAVTVTFGLNRIIDVIGQVGPLIIIISVFIGVASIVDNPSGIQEGHALIPELNLTKASPNWFFAAGSYVGFCMLWLAAFMASMGKMANSRKEAVTGACLGAIMFSLAVIIIAMGLLVNIEQVAGTQIPSLYLAANISPLFNAVFAIIIMAGIYTTAVPLLWSVSSRFTEDRTPKFKKLTIGLTIIATLVALMVDFAALVNVVYVINGYVGIVLLLAMLGKTCVRMTAGSYESQPEAQ